MLHLKHAGSLLKSASILKNAKFLRPISTHELSPEEQKKMDQFLAPKKDPNLYYNGPERDLVNFPRPVRAEYAKLCRMKFIPDSWFQAFYDKTGVTGPYLLGLGIATLMLSKEIIVMEHEFHHGVVFFGVLYVLNKKVGPTVKKMIDDLQDEELAKFENMKNSMRDSYVKFAENERTMQKNADGQLMIVQAKKENVLMQLEAEYRKRLATVYNEVKVRLDYMAAVEESKRRMEQSHMVEWIISNSLKSITPQHEKESLAKCFSDLKTLAAKY